MAPRPYCGGVPWREINPLHRNRITEVNWKDTTLPRTFISDRGKIRARRVTGLTPQRQRQVATAIRNAREMALLQPDRPQRAGPGGGGPVRGPARRAHAAHRRTRYAPGRAGVRKSSR